MIQGTQHADYLPNLTLFREKISAARRQTGRLQRELADALGIDAQVLSRKLHKVQHAFPTHAEVKQIVRTLAAWDAITTRAEAIELLSLMGLRAESFSDQEWNTTPLNRLESLPQIGAPAVTSSLPILYSLSTLPVASTSIIGREYHVQRLLDLLRQPAVRLLTLLGTAGVGKTRLALEVARAAHYDFADGVVFVPLSMIGDAELVPSTIAQTLRLPEPVNGEPSEEQGMSSPKNPLKVFLQGKELLLVLDNVEQIPDIAFFISDLLSIAPALKVLVTSRAVLHLYGEHEFSVPPLELCPLDDRTSDPDYVSQFPAIRLFIERARAVNSAFQINAHNSSTIAQICARLDGLPLAIELAAVRTKVFPLSTIQQRLEDRAVQSLTFLRSGARDVLQRQQTLYDTLDWSYKLLDPQQQRLFRRLSVFPNSWTLQAAQVICLAEDQMASLDIVFEQIESLIDQSLVKKIPLEDTPEENLSRTHGLEPRFQLLETIRDYALVRLEESEEREDLQRRHATYYMEFAERIEANHSGHTQSVAASILACEQDNLQTALAWAVEHGEAEIAQRVYSALEVFWEARAQFQEAYRWIDAALRMARDRLPAVRANSSTANEVAEL